MHSLFFFNTTTVQPAARALPPSSSSQAENSGQPTAGLTGPGMVLRRLAAQLAVPASWLEIQGPNSAFHGTHPKESGDGMI